MQDAGSLFAFLAVIALFGVVAMSVAGFAAISAGLCQFGKSAPIATGLTQPTTQPSGVSPPSHPEPQSTDTDWDAADVPRYSAMSAGESALRGAPRAQRAAHLQCRPHSDDPENRARRTARDRHRPDPA